MTKRQIYLRKKILEYSYKHKLSHIGSCLSVVDIIDAIYAVKKKNDIFILSAGHTGLAQYTILIDKKIMPESFLSSSNFDIHPDRDTQYDLVASTGSLGQGLPIAIGMAIASPKKIIYCLTSDGESAEGSIWEALRMKEELKLSNLVVVMSVNGWGAYGVIDSKKLKKRLIGFGYKLININGHNPNQIISSLKKKQTKPTIIFAKTTSDQMPFLKGQDAHYYTMKDQDMLTVENRFH